MQLPSDMDSVRPKRGKHGKREKKRRQFQNILGLELQSVVLDRVTKTDAEENKRRRAIIVLRNNGKWGFTLQSYGIQYKKENTVEYLTYVDYVEFGGPGHLAGMRAGDVILSINGVDMEETDHAGVVKFIQSCQEEMRMVVLFEDCVRKIELHMKYLKLQRVLTEKLFEMRSLEAVENRILDGCFNRTLWRRQSLTSMNSSLDSSWDDRLSLMPELDRCPTPLLTPPGVPPLSGLSPRAFSASVDRIPNWQNESFRSDSVVLRNKPRHHQQPRELRLLGTDQATQSCIDFSHISRPPHSADSVMARSRLSSSGHFAFHPSISPTHAHALSNRKSDPLHYLSTSWGRRSLRDETLHSTFERSFFGSTSTPIMEADVGKTVNDSLSDCSGSDLSGLHLEFLSCDDNSLTEAPSSGYVSYSDSSAIELQLINEADECTKL